MSMKHAWMMLVPSLLLAQSASFNLSTATIMVPAAAGVASVELTVSPASAAWTASSNAPWLQLSASSTSGIGSAWIQFSYSANSTNAIQTGTLTIAGQTVTIMQAGSNFAPGTALTTLISQGLNLPYGVALDSSGNLYVADTGDNAIQQSAGATQPPSILGLSGLNAPHGVTVDNQGNVYVADAYNNAIKQWNPATGQLNILVSSNLNFPLGVAVDALGNVDIADFGDNAIKQWNIAEQRLITLVGSGLSSPTGVAVDALGNVYIADFRNNAIKEWSPTSGVTTLVSQDLSFPNSVAVDGQGNVYFLDGNNNALKEWNAATHAVSTLISSGINGSFGLATDGQGNFYIANTGTSSILQVSSGYFGFGSASLTEPAQAGTDSVTVQVLGPLTALSATSDQPWLTITGTAAGSISFSFLANTSTASRVAHILVLGQQVTVTQNGDVAAGLTKIAGDAQSTPINQPFPVPLEVNVTDSNGVILTGAAVTFSVNPGSNGAGGVFSPPGMPILTDQNGNATAPALTANAISGPFTVTATVNGLTVNFSLTNVGYALASYSTVVGNAPGSGTALLVTTGPWTASSNAAWLQIAPGSTSGTGSALIQFTYSANTNPGAQTGTLNIAGLTFTVTQAGGSYVPVTPVSTLVSTGLNNPQGVAVDASGNVYIADTANNQIKEWSPITQQTVVLVSGLNGPQGVAVDSSGNVYAADSGNNAIEEFSPPGWQLNTLVSGLNNPSGVAVDSAGNLYFSDTGNSAIKEWNPTTLAISTLVGTGLNNPTGVALDAARNVYFADSGNNTIREWIAVSGSVSALWSGGLNDPTGVAVDGQGNVYVADTGNSIVKEWNAASQQVAALVSTGLNNPAGMAVDSQGGIYVADAGNNAIRKLTPAWLALSTTNITEGSPAGTGSFTAQVLPASVPLTVTSNQSWLTITSTTGGNIAFAFTANSTGSNRTGQITVLGVPVNVTQNGDVPAVMTNCGGNSQSTPLNQPFAAALQACVTDGGGNPIPGISVTFTVTPASNGASGSFSGSSSVQVVTNAAGNATAPVLTANNIGGTFTVTAAVNALTVPFTLTNLVYSLADSSVLVGSAGGTGSVLLTAAGPWTVASNASWLQPTISSGSGSALIEFTYAANTSAATQTGTLNISGLIFTVTQTGTSLTPVGVVTTLISSGLKSPDDVAVDASGNLFIADTGDNEVKEWNASTQAVSILVSGLNAPAGVAVDSQDNVYIADSKNNEIKKWNSATGITILVSSGLSSPSGVAVDSQGNVYFSDSGHNDIKEWVASTGLVSTLVSSGLSTPKGVAVDAFGNVYFADSKNNAVKEYVAATKSVKTLVSGLNAPSGVAVDGGGNVFIADTGNSAIKEWSPITTQVTVLVSSGVKSPQGVAVDSQDNVYIADTGDSAIKKHIAAYFALGATSRTELATAGSDSVTVQILPANTPVTATSNATWLTISGTTGGSVAFSFTANTSAIGRTAQITVLGELVLTVMQSGDTPTTITKSAGNNQSVVEKGKFATALQVKVTDVAGKAIANAAVTFTTVAGSKGANGTFASSPAMPILTTTGGIATAPALTANGTAGAFTVNATVGGLITTFNLTITQ